MTKDELQKAVDDVITDCIRNDYAFGNYAHRVTEAVWPVLEAAEKERDDVAQQLVQSEIGKREISEARDGLQAEVGKLKDLEVSRCVKINGYIVDNARLAEEVERLRAKITEMERQEIGFRERCTPSSPTGYSNRFPRYALPGARSQPAPSVREGWKLVPIEPTEDMLRAMTDPFVAINGDNRKAFESAYTAMLAAAPKPEGESKPAGFPGAQPAPTVAEQDQINAEAAIRSIYDARLSDEALWQTIGNGMITPAHIAQAVADGTIASAYIMQPAPSINEGVRKVTLGFRWESEAQHHIPTIEIEFDPVSPGSPNDAKGWQDRARLASMLTPEAKP